jgi:tripartite-type tricarboxylate transporter receptor subunit TctC
MTKFTRREFNIGASTLGATLATPGILRAQAAYPSQDVHFICAFPAGSGADIIVRWYGEKLRPIFGRAILVENRVGAIGNLATEYTARSKPDGYTIYVHGGSAVAANMHMFKNPTVDASKAIVTCATINRQPTMFCVDPSKPWKSVAEVTAFARERKEKATYATTNPLGKVMGATYKEINKLEAVEVTYRTAVDSLNDLKSGAIDYAMYDNIFAASQAREGRVRILAVSTKERLQANPDIPTMTELGTPMDVTGWFAAMVPSATPRPIVEQIAKMFNEVTATEDAKKFLNSVASDPWINTPDQAQAYMLRQVKDWADYVRIAKIEPQG